MSGEVDPKKKTCFVLEIHIEDARQDEKHVPDLLESIMRPTDPVKEELRPILVKMIQIKSKITNMRVSTFGFRKSEGFAPQANASLLTSSF